jgi:hypothetical protein
MLCMAYIIEHNMHKEGQSEHDLEWPMTSDDTDHHP